MPTLNSTVLISRNDNDPGYQILSDDEIVKHEEDAQFTSEDEDDVGSVPSLNENAYYSYNQVGTRKRIRLFSDYVLKTIT